MKRILVAFLMVVVMSAMAAPACWACSCPATTKKQKAKHADVIFTGKVKSITPVQSDFKVRFRVFKVYKGHPKEFTYVFTPNSGSISGVDFEKDTKYTVFAHWSDGKKYTSSCSGTKQGSIDPDNYGLGEAYPPQNIE
jgi:hypothetical protein